MVSTALSAFLSCWYLSVVFRLRRGLGRVERAGRTGSRCDEKVSAIVAARNEEGNIDACLASVCAQNLPEDDYEVIVADDRSTDRTAVIVREWMGKRSNVRLVQVHEGAPGVAPKKNALLAALGEARFPIIAVTDADCRVPPGWLAGLRACFTDVTGAVQGMTLFARGRPSPKGRTWDRRNGPRILIDNGRIARNAIQAPHTAI